MESKPCPPPSNPSKGPSPPTTSTPATLRATYDTFYDNKSGLMNNVACSNGANGLSSRFPTFGDVPSFPFLGGAFDVVWNSPNCGSCWNLTNPATGTSINIVAIDTAGAGFNIAQKAFVQLNGGQIGQGVLDVVASKVSPSVCGL
ncbi:Cerato-platanin-domain-containing protein [Russula emetica]|nr:Cerato-platanin-domain-containing protein [Russula emetica]